MGDVFRTSFLEMKFHKLSEVALFPCWSWALAIPLWYRPGPLGSGPCKSPSGGLGVGEWRRAWGGPTVNVFYIGGDGGVLGVPVSGVLFWVSLRGEGLCRLLHLCDVVCVHIFYWSAGNDA